MYIDDSCRVGEIRKGNRDIPRQFVQCLIYEYVTGKKEVFLMARYTSSQFRSKLNQIQQKQRNAINNYKRVVNEYNRKVNSYNQRITKAINDYNMAVRKHNANVIRNRQIISNELRRLNSSSFVQTRYVVSSRTMQSHYEAVAREYYEGVSITPEQSRILDLIEQEQANNLVTENYIARDSAPEETPADIEIGNKLALISSDLDSRWKGAVFALNPNNPDASRHFCTSTREIFTEFLEITAPDEKVFAFDPSCAKTDNGNPTRREKIRFLMRDYRMNDNVVSFVDEDISNIIELNHLLSGGTHGPAGNYSFEKLIQVKKRVEQGINFLCEIYQSKHFC